MAGAVGSSFRTAGSTAADWGLGTGAGTVWRPRTRSGWVQPPAAGEAVAPGGGGRGRGRSSDGGDLGHLLHRCYPRYPSSSADRRGELGKGLKNGS